MGISLDVAPVLLKCQNTDDSVEAWVRSPTQVTLSVSDSVLSRMEQTCR
jgi:hypothetical protein